MEVVEEEEEEALPGQSAAPSVAIDCWENTPGPQLCFSKPVACCLLMGPHTDTLSAPSASSARGVHNRTQLSHQRGFGSVRLIYQTLHIGRVEWGSVGIPHGLTLLVCAVPPF